MNEEMEKMEKRNIREKLILVQNRLHVGKTLYNKFGNFSYRSVEEIYKAVKPLLSEENLSLFMTDTIEAIGDRFYIKAEAHLRDNITDEEIVSCAYAREPLSRKGMDESQITGSSSSYARKYALCGLFLLDLETDVDSLDNSDIKELLITEEQKKELLELGTNLEAMATYYRKASIDEVTQEEAQEAIMRKRGGIRK